MPVNSELRLKAVDRVTGVIRKIKRSFPGLSAAVDDSRKRLKKLDEAFGDSLKKMKRFSAGTRRVGRAMTLGLTLPAVIAGGAAVKAYASYEKALIGVGKTTDTEGAKLRTLGLEFRDLSKNIPLSVEQLLALGEAAGQMGRSRKEVSTFADVLAKLQFATDIQGQEGTLGIARILNLANEKGIGSIRKFGATIVGLGNSSAATESQILGVATRVAQATTRFKISSTDILGISTTLKALGVESELAGSATGRGFKQIEDSILSGGQKFKRLQTILQKTEMGGLGQKALRKVFRANPMKVFTAFLTGMNKISKSETANIPAVLASIGLQGVRIDQVFGPLITRIDKFNEKMKRAHLEAKNTGTALDALEVESGRAFKGIGAKATILWNKLRDIGIGIAERWRPKIVKAMESIENVLDSIGKSEGLQDFLVGLGIVLAIMGPIVFVFGVLLSVFAPLIFAATMLGVSLGTLVTPFLLIALGLAMIGVGLYGIFSDLDAWKKKWSDLWDAIVNDFRIIQDSFSRTLDSLGDSVLKKLLALTRKLRSFGKTISQYLPDWMTGGSTKIETNQNIKSSPLGEARGLGPERRVPNRSPNSNIDVSQKAQLDIRIDGPEGFTSKVKKQTGFDKLSINRGYQGAY